MTKYNGNYKNEYAVEAVKTVIKTKYSVFTASDYLKRFEKYSIILSDFLFNQFTPRDSRRAHLASQPRKEVTAP